MKILDRLPIYTECALIDVRGGVFQIWKNQTIVWVSFAHALAPFAAILDTGHSHILSIERRHMKLWGAGGRHGKVIRHAGVDQILLICTFNDWKGQHTMLRQKRFAPSIDGLEHRVVLSRLSISALRNREEIS